MRKTINLSDYNMIAPSGVCRMGSTDVTYYRMNGNRLWFDKKQIEYVLTGKNQNNMLGSYKDARNHGKIFDTQRKEIVPVISKAGVCNYLKKAWSVKDENRRSFYEGLKTIESPKDEKVSEPLQIPMFNAAVEVDVKPFVKISDSDKGYLVDYTVGGKDVAEKHRNLARMLISVANELMTGKFETVKLKEVA